MYQFLQIFVYMRAITVKLSSVSLKIILHLLRLGNQIDHIKPKCPDTFLFPKSKDLFQFLPHVRIIPVQVRLCHIKQMQIPLFQFGDIFPCGAAKF